MRKRSTYRPHHVSPPMLINRGLAESDIETRETLKAIERFEPTQMLPRAREIYRDLVARLDAIEDISAAREALRALIGEVKLLPENGKLTAEIQNAGLAGVCEITKVVVSVAHRLSPMPPTIGTMPASSAA